MDDASERILPLCKCLQSIMPVTNTGIEKFCIKSVKYIIKSIKQKYRSNPYMNDANETILPLCKGLHSIMTVTNMGTEK